VINMQFCYENRKDLESIYIHDTVFYGFEYLYSLKQIKFHCNRKIDNTDYLFTFNNVIFFNVQTCFLWGPGPHILWLSVEEESSYMNEINKLKNDNRLTPDTPLGKNISYIQIIFKLNSGDEIFIICESIDLKSTVHTRGTQGDGSSVCE